jgi:hypothetical protein
MTMRMFRSSLLFLLGSAAAAALLAQAPAAQPAPPPAAPPPPPAPKVEFPVASPAATLKQRVGLTDIEIAYSRPGIKDRVIFGGLVPYDQVWRTGANSATRITFSTPVKLQGLSLEAGVYELFTIPGKEEWTIILQKAAKQWGAYQYKPENDLARVKARPVALAEPVETFTIGLNDLRDESATLNFVWEKTRVPVKIEVDVEGKVVPQIEAAMAAPGKKPYGQAAMFYIAHDLDLKKAVGWLDTAIAEQPNAYYLVYHKARALAKMGDKEGAIATARQSIAMAIKDTGPAKDEYIRLNEALIASLK